MRTIIGNRDFIVLIKDVYFLGFRGDAGYYKKSA